VSRGPWRDGKVPNSAIGERVEHWSKVDNESWFQMIGLISELEGEPGMLSGNVEHMEFHLHPPIPTEADQAWRTL
jgi:hypothetical protein